MHPPWRCLLLYLIFAPVASVRHHVSSNITLLKPPHRCLHLAPDEAVVVYAVKQKYSEGSFLMARTGDTLGEEDDPSMRSLVELLLNGCQGGEKQPSWFVDAGIHDGPLVALASSLGCAVGALDPESTAELEALKCVNNPSEPFEIFPFVAEAQEGNVTLSKGNASRSVKSARLDALFAKNESIALLRVAPRRCCGAEAPLHALQGAWGLLESRRARCAMVEMVLDDSAPQFLKVMREMEQTHHYQLVHAGPVAMPEMKPGGSAPYTLYSTDVTQLEELYDTYLRIRRFDERTGARAYADGMSLSVDGNYFDHTDLVVACQELPKELVVNDKADLRFQGGKWWPEPQKFSG